MDNFMNKDFLIHLSETARSTELILEELIQEKAGHQDRLASAMRHASLGGGKRLRPFLLLSSATLFGVDKIGALRAAAALECIHCYSLVHDDLPAMDDDDLRRGRPTVHIAFDEATAILAGDGLLTLGFEILGDPETHENADVRCQLVAAMARASGARGMIAGQMLDIEAEKKFLSAEEIIEMQKLKTGALIEYACEAGAILGQAGVKAQAALRAYASDLGLAFQITDDLLDHKGADHDVGKRTGKDEERGKATFVSLMGPEGAHEEAMRRIRTALEHLSCFDERAEPLREVAKFVLSRKS
ncbi:MAG TPA: polyprenyl synthetase family protein [Rhizobiales bacterium]|nr:polyprenyl synthetase family protein [Hyphomicrobiales bacterium]